MPQTFEVTAGKLKALVIAETREEAKRIFARSINGHGGSGKIRVKLAKA